jgi:hypothetical protein
MSPVAWMAGLSLLAWVAVAAVGGSRVHPEALFGMAGPLASATATWVAVAWAYRVSPARLMAVLIGGFALKMLFFGGYVAVMLRGFDLRPVPFVASFTGFFIALYAMEALFLKRLTTTRTSR